MYLKVFNNEYYVDFDCGVINVCNVFVVLSVISEVQCRLLVE